MSVPTSITTAFDRAKRYQRLSQAFLRATDGCPTLMPGCSPYESQYGTPHVFAQSTELADIAAFYRACGLKDPMNERVDHIAVELEFMGFLAAKEAYALFRIEPHRAEEVREMQAKFVGDHLGRWVPVFAHHFAGRDPELARELKEWVAEESKRLGVKPAVLRAIDVRPVNDPDEAFECGGGECQLF